MYMYIGHISSKWLHRASSIACTEMVFLQVIMWNHSLTVHTFTPIHTCGLKEVGKGERRGVCEEKGEREGGRERERERGK